MKPSIQGLWPALLLPVTADGAVDAPRAIAHARRMLALGCDGIALFGTTGEGPAFTMAERKSLLEAVLSSGIEPDQIVVTTTTVALGEAIELGRHAAGLGVHRQLFMPPFFFKQPRDAGIVESVSQVVRGIGDDRLKLLLYHFPMMSTSGFSHGAIRELVRRHPGQIAGVKDSAGDRAHSLGLVKSFPELAILVGAELDIAAVMVEGGQGSINGLGNIAPGLLRRVVDAPGRVAGSDVELVTSLLALLGIRPNLPFVCVYKAMLAEQTGDDVWLNVRAPLSQLTTGELQAVREGYRAIGPALADV